MLATALGAAAIGVALGLFGSGGSILTVPVLAYGLGLPEKSAIASSLAIVGTIAALGSLLQARHGLVVGRCILAFGLPGVAGAAAGGLLAGWMPGPLQMTLFALVALAAALQMLRSLDPVESGAVCGPLSTVAAAGAGVGALTAIIGVGGGFLLVPALIRFGRLPLPQAIATSLSLIALNAFTGLAGQLASPAALVLEARVIVPFVLVGALGLVAGTRISARLPRRGLRHGFVAMLLAVSGLVLWRFVAL